MNPDIPTNCIDITDLTDEEVELLLTDYDKFVSCWISKQKWAAVNDPNADFHG